MTNPESRAAQRTGTEAVPALEPAQALFSRAPIESESLFVGAREVQIAHRGSLYRLKQTSLGKLILTK